MACSSASEERDMSDSKSAAMDSVAIMVNTKENTFLDDSLSTEQLQIFSKRAIQKLYDYYNYMELLSDSTLEPSMREHTLNVLSKLIFEKNKILPDSILQQKLLISKIDSVSSIEKLNDTLYKGIIYYELSNRMITQSNFYIQKSTKTFGNEQKKVWEALIN